MKALFESISEYWRISVVFIGLVVLMIVLKELKFVFMPLAISIILAFLLSPIITTLRERGIPTIIIIVGVILILAVIFTLVGFLLYQSVLSVFLGIGTYEENINLQISNFVDYFGLQDTQIDWTSVISSTDIKVYTLRVVNSFTSVVGYILLIVLFTSFLTASRLTFFKKLSRAMSKDRAYKIKSIYNKIEKSIQTYLYTKIMISIITALISAVIMMIFRVDFVFILAAIIFFFNFIPNIGSIVATAFPIILYFLKFGFTYQFVALIILLSATQFIMGNIIEPRWAGKGLNLSPVLIIVSLMIWFYIWGISGMLIAVPILSITKIVFEHIDFTKNLAKFMSID